MYSPRFEAALHLASIRHQDQRRKGGAIPYVTHLMHVAWLVAQDGGDEDAMIVALLHDVLEDTVRTREELAALTTLLSEKFGSTLTQAIEALSEPKRGADGHKLPWRSRKEAYLRQLEAAGPLVHRVSAADKLHNLATLNEDLAEHAEVVWQRFSAGPTETLWFYRSATELLDQRIPQSRLVASLRAEVERLTRLIGS